MPTLPMQSRTRSGTQTASRRLRRRSNSSMRAAATSCSAAGCGEDKATLHELADEYGVSAERIRQIEANAIKKLRGLMAA